jgi:hypothetical protein
MPEVRPSFAGQAFDQAFRRKADCVAALRHMIPCSLLGLEARLL